MKRALAILFSISLVCAQAVATGGLPLAGARNTACTCCDCGGTDCCVSPSSPGANPLPAAPARAGSDNQLQLSLVTVSSLVWELPQAQTQRLSPSLAPSDTAGLPLFTRHCALLI